MKKLFTIVSVLILAVSCNTNKHINASAIGLVNLKNYAARNAADLPYSYNYKVITNQADFDNTFGINRSGNINITYPSFNGQTVVACIAQPSTHMVTIRFDKAEVAGKDLYVYCTTTESKEQLKTAIIPVAVATVPKVLDVKRVHFFTNGEKATTRTVDFESQEVMDARITEQDAKPVVLKRTMRRPAVI